MATGPESLPVGRIHHTVKAGNRLLPDACASLRLGSKLAGVNAESKQRPSSREWVVLREWPRALLQRGISALGGCLSVLVTLNS